MRKLYLLKTFLLACLFSIVGGGMAWAETVTDTLDFSTMGLKDKQVVTSWKPASVHNISVSFQKDSAATAPTYYSPAIRVYKSGSFVVSVPKGKVLQRVVMEFGSGEPTPLCSIIPSKGSYSESTKTWTPSSESVNSVTFTVGTEAKHRRIKALIITFEKAGGESSLLPAELSFSASTASADLYKSTEFKAPTLTKPDELTVTYSSSDKAVATVDANTGVVTLVGVGSTIITASSEKTETYDAGSASYTLNVTDSSPYFRFAKTDYSVMLITAFAAPTVETNVEGAPAYSSSVPSVATVDSETGAVTLVAPGTTTITATLAPYSASYTLTVTPLSAVFAPVTAQSEVVDGGTYIVLNKDGDKAMGVNNSTKFMNAVDVTLDNGLYTGDVDDEGQPYAFQLVAKGEDYKFQHGDTYLKYGGSKTNTTLASLSSGDEFLWKIDLGTTYASPIFNKKDSGRQLGYSYNGGDKPRFAAYSTSNSSQYPAVLYRQYSASDLQLTISDAAGYATYYSDKAFVVPAGMEATTVTAANNDGTLTMAWEYQAGSIVPAETAVLLRGEAKTYNACQLNDYTVAAPTGNLLHGSVEAATTTGGAKYYKLTYATIGGQRTLGFFWGAEDGAAFTNAAGKAYLALPAEAAANGYRLDGGDVTGIGQIATDAQGNGQVYSISGVRMDGSKRLPAGIYVINGRKVIVK